MLPEISKFLPYYEDLALDVGIDPNQEFTFDGKWHDAKPAEEKYDGKVRYLALTKQARSGLEYPIITFFTNKHSGVHRVFNGYEVAREFAQQSKPKPNHNRIDALNKIYSEAVPLTDDRAAIAWRYFESRGIGEILNDLPRNMRFHPSAEYKTKNSTGQWVTVGRFPTLLSLIISPAGKAVGLHHTYLAKDGSSKANVPGGPKKTWSIYKKSTQHAAIRLYPAGERLVIGEGIETVLSVRLDTGFPVWAAGDAPRMKGLWIPDEIEEILIAADNDEAGRKAATDLAISLYYQRKKVKILYPPEPGTDWLDVYNKGQRKHG